MSSGNSQQLKQEDDSYQDRNNNNNRDTNSPDNNNRNSNNRQQQQSNTNIKPDYGTAYVPGAGPVQHAPKSLDHFKRGYEERAAQRDKEMYTKLHGPTGKEKLNITRQQQQQQHRAEPPSANYHHHNNHRNNNNNNYPSKSSSYQDDNYNNNYYGRDNRNNNNNYQPNNNRRNNYNNNNRNNNNFDNENNNNFRRGGGGGGGGNVDNAILMNDRPVLVHGVNINNIIDRLSKFYDDKDAIFNELNIIKKQYNEIFISGKAMTALISVAARKKNITLGHYIWEWMDYCKLYKNTFHYNSMISVTEKSKNYKHALFLLNEMTTKNIPKNEVTFSSAISACEKCGQWKTAIELLNSMEQEGVARTAIAYNAAISACEKGMNPQKACEIFQRMKNEGIEPSVVSYSALISAAEKGGQWKLALEILDEMKNSGFRGNVVAYSAAISACARGQQWKRALQLFREIQAHGGIPSVVTWNATITALEKGMQWERALDLFEEMKMRNLPITVVSYGSAISACDKGFQYRQCLEFLDEMTEMGIEKNVIIFGAAMSCMEKCGRADIGFQLLQRMKEEGIQPNTHTYNSAISACARSNLWEKGYELYEEMERNGVKRDVVTYNAVLEAVSSQIRLGRRLFKIGVEKGFYAKVSRLGESWFELDLHFLSLGGAEIALGWWFEECLVPYLQDTKKLDSVKSISIVTGFGRTRTRGQRAFGDSIRNRAKAMLRFMNIKEVDQPNPGRICVDKDNLIEEVNRNGGKVTFDLDGYVHWKETETTANAVPDTPQKIRARFKPEIPGSGRPPFIRVENDNTSEEYRLENQRKRMSDLDRELFGDKEDYSSNVDYAARDGIRFRRGGEYSNPRAPYDNQYDEYQRDNGHYGPSRNAANEQFNGQYRNDSRGLRERPQQFDDQRRNFRQEESFGRGPSFKQEDSYTDERHNGGYNRSNSNDRGGFDDNENKRFNHRQHDGSAYGHTNRYRDQDRNQHGPWNKHEQESRNFDRRAPQRNQSRDNSNYNNNNNSCRQESSDGYQNRDQPQHTSNIGRYRDQQDYRSSSQGYHHQGQHHNPNHRDNARDGYHYDDHRNHFDGVQEYHGGNQPQSGYYDERPRNHHIRGNRDAQNDYYKGRQSQRGDDYGQDFGYGQQRPQSSGSDRGGDYLERKRDYRQMKQDPDNDNNDNYGKNPRRESASMDGGGSDRRLSTSSRGYTLEPQVQRRRLS